MPTLLMNAITSCTVPRCSQEKLSRSHAVTRGTAGAPGGLAYTMIASVKGWQGQPADGHRRPGLHTDTYRSSCCVEGAKRTFKQDGKHSGTLAPIKNPVAVIKTYIFASNQPIRWRR